MEVVTVVLMRKKPKKWKINSSWICQRIDVTGQIAALNLGVMGEYGESHSLGAKLPGARD